MGRRARNTMPSSTPERVKNPAGRDLTGTLDCGEARFTALDRCVWLGKLPAGRGMNPHPVNPEKSGAGKDTTATSSKSRQPDHPGNHFPPFCLGTPIPAA